jgi:hypothetical protein
MLAVADLSGSTAYICNVRARSRDIHAHYTCRR